MTLPEDLTKISIMTHNTKGGFYNISKDSNLPDYAREDVVRNGAVYLAAEDGLLHEYLTNKVTQI
jgi:hypothetical protein